MVYHGIDSDEYTACSDTDKDENEEARVTETYLQSGKHGTSQQPEKMHQKHLVHPVRPLHLLILLQGTMQFFNPSVDNSSCELSLNSRDDEAEHTRCKKVPKNSKTKKTRKTHHF